jgi:SAM-dependent methyltransferase
VTSRRVEALRARWFGTCPNDWQSYHALVAQRLRPGMTVVEVGPGKGRIAPFPWDQYPGIDLIGLDPDSQAASNPYLDRFALLPPDAEWPIRAGIADLVVARYVLEHVADPDRFLASVARTLRPGGAFVFLTPNRRSPIMWLPRILSHRLHVRILAATREADAGDVFPTHYRANTLGALAAMARRHGLVVEHLEANEFTPFGYLDFALPGFLIATAYRRVLIGAKLEGRLGISITGVVTKPALRT